MINDYQTDISLEQYNMEKGIKHTAGRCAMILFILSVSTYIFAGLLTLILKLRARSIGALGSGISSDAYTFLLGYMPCILGDILAIFVAYKTFGIKIKRDLYGKNKASLKFIFIASLSCIGIGMISSIIYAIYSSIIEGFGMTIPSPDFSMPSSTAFKLLFIAYTCIIAPIMEETIFRGFILRSLQKYGNFTAMIVTSILFAMFHCNLVQFINPILMGLMLAFIAIKSNSIKASIAAHMFNNSLAMVATALTGQNNYILMTAFSMIYLLVGIIAFIVFLSNYLGDFAFIKRESTYVCQTWQKVKYAFTSKWSIAYIILYCVLVFGIMILSNI